MIPNITRGGDVRGVLWYLVGKGRREEHKDPHLVAGSPEAFLRSGGRLLERRDVGVLAGLLDEPREAFGVQVRVAERDQDGRVVGSREAHVWHCSLSLHPDEPALEDGRWGEICDRFIARMGFAGGQARSQCRWVAVRHGRSHGGSDHAHLVVGLVAEDGSKASVHNERWRTQQACRELEREFGLRELEARGRGTGERGIKAGELAADGVRGRRVGERQQHPERGSRRTLERIVRACAAAARDEADFVTRLRGEGLLARARYEHGGTSEVAGYSVGLAPRDGERPVWYGGGRLSRELTLPRLRENWPELDARVQSEAWQARASGRGRRTSTGPSTELQAQCARELAKLRDQLREVPIGERGTWAHVARETSGVLAAWSLRTEPQPGPLAQASRSLARSAQLHAGDVRQRRRGHIPPARRAAQLLLAAAVGGSPSSAMLMRELIGLSLAIRDMHAAAGELGRAQELEQTARRELEQVSSLLLGREIREQATGQAGTQRGRSGVESPGAER